MGLAIILPLVALAITLAQWKSGMTRRAWALVVGLQAVLLVSGLVAQRTGSAEEDAVEAVVAESAIERHEEAAELFLVGVGAALALAALVLVVPARAARYGALAASLATVAVAGLGVRVGHAGGRLVYESGAAQAYQVEAARSSAGGSTAAESEIGGGTARAKADDDDR
jgi:hypothetical protein